MHTYKESDPEVRQRVMGVGYKMKLGGKARVDVCVCGGGDGGSDPIVLSLDWRP